MMIATMFHLIHIGGRVRLPWREHEVGIEGFSHDAWSIGSNGV